MTLLLNSHQGMGLILLNVHIVTQNDDIEVTFMHITIPSLHFEYPLGLGLGLGLGLSVYP